MVTFVSLVSVIQVGQILGYVYLIRKSKRKIGHLVRKILLYNIFVGTVTLALLFARWWVSTLEFSNKFKILGTLLFILYYSNYYWINLLLRFKRIQVVLLCEKEDTRKIIEKIERTLVD